MTGHQLVRNSFGFSRIINVVLIYAVLHLLIVAPLAAQLESLNKQEGHLKSKFEREQHKLVMREPLMAKLKEMVALDQALTKQLPVAITDRQATTHFIAIANAQAIDLEAVEVLAPITREFYGQKTVAISGQASYPNFVRFLQAINQYQQLAWCDGLRLTPSVLERWQVDYELKCALPYATRGVEKADG
jgi:Tfp pilus assembly protein PilO